MANTVRTIDLDADPDDFEETYAELLVAVKHNYDEVGNLAGAMDPSSAVQHIIAEYTNLIDDFILECQSTKLRFVRFGTGAPAVAADIGAQYTDTSTGHQYINRTGASNGWQPSSTVTGVGAPEGSVAAAPGVFYMRTDSFALFIKRTGTGNTGWSEVALV